INYTSLKLRLYSVQPDDYPKWLEYQNPTQASKRATLPGKLILARTIPVAAKPEQTVETAIDLGPALKDGHGQVILVVESPETRVGAGYLIETWLQRTDIGLDAFIDKTNLVGWATSLRDGSALNNVEIELKRGGAKQSTNSDGTAR